MHECPLRAPSPISTPPYFRRTHVERRCAYDCENTEIHQLASTGLHIGWSVGGGGGGSCIDGTAGES